MRQIEEFWVLSSDLEIAPAVVGWLELSSSISSTDDAMMGTPFSSCSQADLAIGGSSWANTNLTISRHGQPNGWVFYGACSSRVSFTCACRVGAHKCFYLKRVPMKELDLRAGEMRDVRTRVLHASGPCDCGVARGEDIFRGGAKFTCFILACNWGRQILG